LSEGQSKRYDAAKNTETILVVEDEEILRKLICEILSVYGYNVLEAPQCGSALLTCEQYKNVIHLLLTDVVMPE
jgi:CheY-like chemotaxis protein